MRSVPSTSANPSPASIPFIPTPPEAEQPAPKKRKRASTTTVDKAEKRHVCDWENCGKAFSRADHLARHKLNHAPSQIYTCPRCQKLFVRADLLVRHTERHERRESGHNSLGGPSNIHLSSLSLGSSQPSSTSNSPDTDALAKAWQEQQTQSMASQGFFPLPPSNPPTGTPSGTETSTRASSVDITVASVTSAYTLPAPITSLTDPTSYHNFAAPSVNPDFTTTQPLLDFYPSITLPHQPHSSALNNQDLNSSAASSTSNAHTILGLDDPFNFIQSSYGAPFVSGFEYDWLFDGTSNFDVTLGSSRPASPGPGHESDELDFGALASFESAAGGVRESLGPGDPLSGENLANLGFGDVKGDSFGTSGASFGGGFGQSTDWTQMAQDPTAPSPIVKEEDEVMTTAATIKEVEMLTHPSIDSFKSPRSGEQPSPNDTETPTHSTPTLATEHSPAVMSDSDGPSDPSIFIDAQTRFSILEYLRSDFPALSDDKRFSSVAMQSYLLLFWTRVHETQGPAIHRASFRPHQVPIPLLLAMMMLGCYFADLDAHQLSTKLHPFLRGKFLCSNDFKPRSPLWVHQTALLIILYGKMCSTRAAHEQAHVFWSAVITLARRSGLFSQRTVPIPEEYKDDLEVRWAAWIEEESAKRISHVGFSVDVEHAALFRHSPTLSAFQIQLCLPCDDDEWEAPTAAEWAVIHARARPPMPFISALKSSLAPGGGHSHALNPFSRILILHGLLSVAQDLQWRDHMILSQSDRPQMANWRDTMTTAYNGWKSRLDDALLTASSPNSQLLRASISLYALAHISLSIDLHELQIFAGADTALGLQVSSALYQATTTRIRIWAASKDGRSASWHAAHFIRSSLEHWLRSKDDLAACLHHRWSVYIACLTLYCFGTSTAGAATGATKDFHSATLVYLDAMCSPSPEGLLAVENRNALLCLCQTIQEYIQASRWEIAQEGGVLLRKLIPEEFLTK